MQTDGFCPAREDGLCPVKELEGLHFKIPAYQRGYRWTEKEVKTLLEDIVDFIQEGKPEEFYSLQPIVLQAVDEIYHVIDGQQRLTTIFLIVKYLDNKDLFSLNYETREKSFEFLHDIARRSKQEKDLNIDFYHFKMAYETIERFFEQTDRVKKQEFLSTLLNRCKVLWHKSVDEEKEVFVRLNSGKIPLEEAENIKALFLAQPKGTQTEKEVEKRAKKWYEAEKKARDDRDFIYCVLASVDNRQIIEGERPTLSDDLQRIIVYLKAIAPVGIPQKEGALFDHFYQKYKGKSMGEEWGKLEKAIDSLNGWAKRKMGADVNDKKIFHYVGFLIHEGACIASLYEKWVQIKSNQTIKIPKQAFVTYLFEQIKKRMRSIERIEDLSYNENNDKRALLALLLLFNMECHVAKDVGYFQFNRFVLEQWTLEHVYAQNSEGVVAQKDLEGEIQESLKEKIVAWLKEVEDHLEEGALKEEIRSFLEELPSLENFSKHLEKRGLLKKIDEAFLGDGELHLLQNLTLLDKSSNSALGNLIFSKKQEKIRELDDQQKLIPIGTRMVFLKEFSKPERRSLHIFTKEDQEDYLEAIRKHLDAYSKDEGARQ
ncbi:DUF262 domain-containing protein [Helicobacter ailurogastricus]|uniref:DUF262 domain-containing protein n=1 Tax=Helicobacter ailurogastricus TaxID=1578720 RepID=UPI000CF1686A|nr:DUF262 domain-containing protein [Helicobacter ailurogastricus]